MRQTKNFKPNHFIETHNDQTNFVYVILLVVGILIIIVRVIYSAPIITPDSHNYINLANNLIEHRCYGNVEIISGNCEPTWGFQPPGYPMFISLVGLVFGRGPELVDFAQKIVFSQILIFMLVVINVLWASYSWHKSLIGLLITSIIITFSPLSVAWPRWVLTETLAAASGLWVFAILIQSLRDLKIPLFRAGLSVAVAIFIRWDMIWLFVPVVVCALSIYGTKKGLLTSMKIGLLAAIPVMAMIIRAAWVGLPLVPKGTSPESDPSLSTGAVSFWKAAAVTQDAISGFHWPIWVRQYSGIASNLDLEGFHQSYRSQALEKTIEKISMLTDGDPFPVDLDGELELLVDLGSKRGLATIIDIYLQRAIKMWTLRDTIFQSGWASLPEANFVENISHVYRIILLITCFVLLTFAKEERLVLMVGLIALIIIRTFFLSFLTMIEIRYLVPLFPVIELCLILTLFLELQYSKHSA